MIKWFAKQRAKAELMKIFRSGDIGLRYSYGSHSGLVYPKILSVTLNESKQTLRYSFSLPLGMDPKEISKKEYCFKQVFGERIEIKGDTRRFALTVFTAPVLTMVKYDADSFKKQAQKANLPIVCGEDMNGSTVVYDMVKHPHLLIAGETGSGKSTQLRSILTSLIQYKKPRELQMYLCDLKRSEFHLFRQVDHVKGVYISPVEIASILLSIQAELQNRGDLLDKNGLSHIDDLKDPPPYIILCIDEVALLRKERAIMAIVEDISAVGRALGVFLILSMQRPDAKLLEGALKNNLTVRMGFKCADLINSRIIGTPGSEKLKVDGRMLLKLQGTDSLKEIQAPYLAVDEAKEILAHHKSPVGKQPLKQPLNEITETVEIQESIFEVLDK